MNYKDEWRLLAISDNLDDVEHRPLTEEFLSIKRQLREMLKRSAKIVNKNVLFQKMVWELCHVTPITNLKYHFVITTAMITRMCGQNGMELEQAFRLSDFYIQKLDDLHTAQEVQNLHEEMVIDYTERMRREIRKDVISKHVSDCKDYIYCHVKERITVEQLASEFGISASYLSRLFKKEVGVSVSTYVKNKKIEVAKDLLKFSDYSMIEIANHLSFSSQSHFIQQFKEVVGITPKTYRDTHHNVKWNKKIWSEGDKANSSSEAM